MTGPKIVSLPDYVGTGGASLLQADALAMPIGTGTVDLIVTSPPYFALRSYQDGGEHYSGQIGSEPSPTAFLEALWAVTAECWRVLKPGGSLFVNLGDKYAGSGGHNNSGVSGGASQLQGRTQRAVTVSKATRRSAPDRYNQASDVRAKSLMGLPWRYAVGCTDGMAGPCTRDHVHLGRGPALLPSERCTGAKWILRAEIIWSKPNGLPESVTDRVRRSHEQWFHLTKEGRYYADVDPIREVHTSGPGGLTWEQRKASGEPMRHGDAAGGASEVSGNRKAPCALGKLPNSVWTIATQPLIVPPELGDHFAAFPTEWPRRLILGWSPSGICTACGNGRTSVSVKNASGKDRGGPNPRRVPGLKDVDRSDWTEGVTRQIVGESCGCPDATAPTRPSVVLDPFGGTGTTAMVAKALGRYGVSMDLSADYLRLANWRVFQSGHGDKAIRRTNAEAQLDIFGALDEVGS